MNVTNNHNQLHTFLGSPAVVASSALRSTLDRASQLAQRPEPAWILGEPGSGKELLARAIHVFSPQQEQAWLCVNCTTLTAEQLTEFLAEPSLLEKCAGGTLVVDQFDRLSDNEQHNLFLQLEPIVRRQATKLLFTCQVRPQTTAIRIPSHCGHLVVPPLRLDREQIIALSIHFLAQINPALTMTADAMQALELYSWPGNVRELKAAIGHAAPLACDGQIATSHLPAIVREAYHGSSSIQSDLKRLFNSVHSSAELAPGHPGRGMLRNLQTKLLQFAMEQAKQNPAAAAKMLGITEAEVRQQLRLQQASNESVA